ncbi:MAG: hypothetical protein HS115_18830 [Spirochaetales bacterium]|nr:hypothetical protein [Spirochaetales bacterium]
MTFTRRALLLLCFTFGTALAETAEEYPDAYLDKEVQELQTPALVSTAVGGATLRLIDISLIGDFAAVGSPLSQKKVFNLQGGNHDPRSKAFSVPSAELSLGGAVDPYFYGEAHVLFGEGFVELEEAFLTSQRLPYGLELEAGHFLTEFGLANPTHPHTWTWLDSPVIQTRLFGGDGMRASGLRLGYLTPLPWYSEVNLGVQTAAGETMKSFLGEQSSGGGHAHAHAGGEPAEIGGADVLDRETASSADLVYLLRLVNSIDLGQSTAIKLGLSGLAGPNRTGPDGFTSIYGGDLLVKWKPARNRRGFPYVAWQTEVMAREYTVHRRPGIGDIANTEALLSGSLYGTYENQEQFTDSDFADIRSSSIESKTYGDFGKALDLLRGVRKLEQLNEREAQETLEALDRSLNPYRKLHDRGFYTQLAMGFAVGWTAGLRYEYATGRGESRVSGGKWLGQDIYGRDRDPQRDTRRRISPLVSYQPSEFSRLRLQYNHEVADHLRDRRTYVFDLSRHVPGAPSVPYELVWSQKSKASWSVLFSAQFLIGSHPAHQF